MEQTFKHKLDIYYLATIGYGVTLVVYVAVTGTLIDDRFELVWADPIVYVLALCSVVSLIALVIAAVLDRTVVVHENELLFRTRFKERRFGPDDLEWIGFRSDSRVKVRGGRAYPAVRMKVRNRRRLLRLGIANFERRGELARALRDWGKRNGVALRFGRRLKRSHRGDDGEATAGEN
jgi:hypothetical protein